MNNQENVDQAQPEELVVRNIRCRITDAEYIEATPERMNDKDVAILVYKVMVVCEDVETGEIGGGMLSAEDISAIAGVEKVMGPREMIAFADRLNAYEGEFIMPVPVSGLIPIDSNYGVDDVTVETEPQLDLKNYPIYPPLSESELNARRSEDNTINSAHSLGTKFAAQRQKIKNQ